MGSDFGEELVISVKSAGTSKNSVINFGEVKSALRWLDCKFRHSEVAAPLVSVRAISMRILIH